MARKSDVLSKYSGNLWNDDDFNLTRKRVSKCKLDLFLGTLEGSIEKAVEYFKVFMDSEQLMNAALVVIEKNMGQSSEIRKLYEKLRQLQHERLVRMANKLKHQATEVQVVEIQKAEQQQQYQVQLQAQQSYGLVKQRQYS